MNNGITEVRELIVQYQLKRKISHSFNFFFFFNGRNPNDHRLDFYMKK